MSKHLLAFRLGSIELPDEDSVPVAWTAGEGDTVRQRREHSTGVLCSVSRDSDVVEKKALTGGDAEQRREAGRPVGLVPVQILHPDGHTTCEDRWSARSACATRLTSDHGFVLCEECVLECDLDDAEGGDALELQIEAAATALFRSGQVSDRTQMAGLGIDVGECCVLGRNGRKRPPLFDQPPDLWRRRPQRFVPRETRSLDLRSTNG